MKINPTNRPLWQVMHDAICSICGKKAPYQMERQLYAALLRAIAKWVEERTAATTVFGSDDMSVVWRVAGMLLAEADRAEAGE